MRSWRRLDAAIEQLIPPLSVPVLLGGLVLLGSLLVEAWPAALLVGVSLLAQIAYLATGLLLVKAPLRAYLALSSAPVYIAWKAGVYAHSLLNLRATTWIRTARRA